MTLSVIGMYVSYTVYNKHNYIKYGGGGGGGIK